MSVKRLLYLLDRRAKKVRDERLYGTLGRKNLDGSVTVLGSRQNTVIVNMGSGVYTELSNTGSGHVPVRANLPVKMLRLHSGDLVLDGVDDRLLEGDEGGPGAYGVPPHAATHEPGGSDEVLLDFTDLGDVPGAYTGQTGKVVKVNAAEDGLEFATEAGATVVSVNGQTGVVVLDPDDLDDTATTHKFTTAAEAAKLAGIAAGAEVNVNADWTAVSGDALILNKPTIPTLPVKATGAEVDTGTDDAKFVTPKAMEDSSYIKAAYADAKVADVITDGVTTVAPSENAVFDALATKQGLDATLTSIAGLGTAADKMLYSTAVDTWAEVATLAYGRSLLGAANIAAAQTTLALVPGTNVQAQDAELAAIAGLTSAADKLPYFTGSGTASLADLSAFARTLIDDAAAVNMRATLGLVIGTDVQAQDAELAAIAGLTSAADRLPYFTGLGTATLATFTAFGRTLGALADAAAGIAALGLDAIYGRLAAANTWTQKNQFNPTNTTGVGLGVTRNLTSTSTDSPVVSILQDHTGDDQAALVVEQDGTGDILSLLDGAVEVFSVADGGQVDIHAPTSTSSILNMVADGARAQVLLKSFRNSAAQSFYQMAGARGSEATPLNSVSADIVAQFAAYGYNETEATFRNLGLLQFEVDATPGAVGVPGRIAFYTTPDGATVSVQRMTIKSTGEVGIGIAALGASILGIKAGASTNDAAVGGLLWEGHSATGNVGTGEDDLLTYSVPANTLSVNGMSLSFEASGTCAANLNVKTLRVRFGTSGTSLIAQFTVTTSGGGSNWVVRGRIIRTGAATQKGYATVVGSNITNTSDLVTGLNQTLSGAVSLRITGESAAVSNNDIVCESLIVNWDDVNT